MVWDRSDCAWPQVRQPSVAELASVPQADPAPRLQERRMQVRAYNFWASMLGHRRYPAVADLSRGGMRDFGPRAVLLDFSQRVNSPRIAYLGEELAQLCGIDAAGLQSLCEAPEGSLLARLSAHHPQVLTTSSPTGFDSAFVGPQQTTIFYRGIMLPFSSDDATIDYVLAVVNWKEVAGDASLEPVPTPGLRRAQQRGMVVADWADGPGSASGAMPEPIPAEFPPSTPDWMEALAARPSQPLQSLAPSGSEYALVLVRRTASGSPGLIGEVLHDPALLSLAAGRLAG